MDEVLADVLVVEEVEALLARRAALCLAKLGWDSLSAADSALPRRPTSRPSRHQNDPDPQEAPYAPKPCSSLEIDGRPMDRAPWPRGRSKAAGAPH